MDEGRIEQLERDFSEEEVWEGLMQCDKDKSSGPDGFNLGFIQKCWHFIKDEIMEIFRELDEKETFVKSLNSTFLVLIAKVEGVHSIKDSRPISLVECIYKIILKVLARRMSKVLGKVIGESNWGKSTHICGGETNHGRGVDN